MVSVTSDISVSTSFQAPPPRGKAEQPPANDSFASLVDSNNTAAASNNDRAQDRAQDRSQDASPAPRPASADKRAAPSRRDDTLATDKEQSRDSAADKPERNDSADTDSVAADQAGADQATQADGAKSKATKPAEKPASDDTAASNTTDIQAAADQASAATADAIAAAIPVAIVVTDAPATSATQAATAVSSTANSGPPAIAAAAFAASTAVTEAPAAPATTPANAEAAGKAAPTDTKADAQAAAGEPVVKVKADAKGSDTPATTGIALVAAPRPAAPKTAASFKPSAAAASDSAAASDDADASTITADAPATNATTTPVASGAEQPTVAKPNVRNAHVESVKTETAGAQTPSTAAAHLNSAGSHDGAPGQADVQANNVQATTTFQPLLQTTAAQAQPSLTVTAATQSAAVPLSGLAMEIAASVRSGKSRFEIRLDPAELGRIDVRIDVDRNGQVTSHLTVEKPETLSMLRQDAPQLQRALNDAGLSTGDNGLQFSLRDQSSSGQNGNQSNPNAQRLILTEEETAPAALASSYGRMLGASGALDIRV